MGFLSSISVKTLQKIDQDLPIGKGLDAADRQEKPDERRACPDKKTRQSQKTAIIR